jgi:hypothetical protein
MSENRNYSGLHFISAAKDTEDLRVNARQGPHIGETLHVIYDSSDEEDSDPLYDTRASDIHDGIFRRRAPRERRDENAPVADGRHPREQDVVFEIPPQGLKPWKVTDCLWHLLCCLLCPFCSSDIETECEFH